MLYISLLFINNNKLKLKLKAYLALLIIFIYNCLNYYTLIKKMKEKEILEKVKNDYNTISSHFNVTSLSDWQ